MTSSTVTPGIVTSGRMTLERQVVGGAGIDEPGHVRYVHMATSIEGSGAVFGFTTRHNKSAGRLPM